MSTSCTVPGASLDPWDLKPSFALPLAAGSLHYRAPGLIVLLAWHCWRSYFAAGGTLLALAAFSPAALLANNVLQEAALFASLAFGLALLIAGLAPGHTRPRRLGG